MDKTIAWHKIHNTERWEMWLKKNNPYLFEKKVNVQEREVRHTRLSAPFPKRPPNLNCPWTRQCYGWASREAPLPQLCASHVTSKDSNQQMLLKYIIGARHYLNLLRWIGHGSAFLQRLADEHGTPSGAQLLNRAWMGLTRAGLRVAHTQGGRGRAFWRKANMSLWFQVTRSNGFRKRCLPKP